MGADIDRTGRRQHVRDLREHHGILHHLWDAARYGVTLRPPPRQRLLPHPRRGARLSRARAHEHSEPGPGGRVWLGLGLSPGFRGSESTLVSSKIREQKGCAPKGVRMCEGKNLAGIRVAAGEGK